MAIGVISHHAIISLAFPKLREFKLNPIPNIVQTTTCVVAIGILDLLATNIETIGIIDVIPKTSKIELIIIKNIKI